jgi:nitrite reductase/ring-hydroxylating ferredoxin subunit
MNRHTICRVEDVVVGKLLPVTIGRSAIIVYRLPTGDVKAISGRCPHQGADLSYACITGTTTGDHPHEVSVDRLGEILRCPWHGFEFDLMTGCPLVKSSSMRLREYRTVIEGDNIIIET